MWVMVRLHADGYCDVMCGDGRLQCAQRTTFGEIMENLVALWFDNGDGDMAGLA